jgi:diphosphomevalonate decarboxylase
MKSITVKAYANIALNKYWGKRDEVLFLPTKSSLSVTLDALQTQTAISFSLKDEICIDGFTVSSGLYKNIIDFLNLFRQLYGITQCFSIKTKNSFATAAGLGSSASGFAALAYGLAHLCQLGLTDQAISVLARRGSGSACRSIHGGFVVWHQGFAVDGSDSCAQQIVDHTHWPDFRVLIVVVESGIKKISSRVGMQQSVATSPVYATWLAESARRLPLMIDALRAKDFVTLGTLTEADWQGMHGVMISTQPPLDYWTDASIRVIATVRSLRDCGIPCFFTTDAGPNIKVFCLQYDQDVLLNALHAIDGVNQVISSAVAPGPEIV